MRALLFAATLFALSTPAWAQFGVPAQLTLNVPVTVPKVGALEACPIFGGPCPVPLSPVPVVGTAKSAPSGTGLRVTSRVFQTFIPMPTHYLFTWQVKNTGGGFAPVDLDITDIGSIPSAAASILKIAQFGVGAYPWKKATWYPCATGACLRVTMTPLPPGATTPTLYLRQHTPPLVWFTRNAVGAYDVPIPASPTASFAPVAVPR